MTNRSIASILPGVKAHRPFILKLYLLPPLLLLTALPYAVFYPPSLLTAGPETEALPIFAPSTFSFSMLPLPAPAETPRRVKVPIIMYHHIADPPPRTDDIRRDLSLPPQLFERHLRYLVEAGYQPITLYQLARHLREGAPLPPRPIILTFDDGYRDHYTHAYPLLKEYGFVGTFFLISGPIDWGNKDYLSWEQVEIMSAGGMEFGDHSYDHPDLRGRPLDFVTWQVISPKEAIEKHTGQEVLFFCYPSGSYDRQVIDVLRSAGFWGGITTRHGVWHCEEELFQLRRIRVHGSDLLSEWVSTLNEALEQGN